MALIRFNKVAFEWNGIYAVVTVRTNDDHTLPAEVWVYCDFPHVAPGDAAVKLTEFNDAVACWNRVAKDKRLKQIGTVCLDVSKVIAINKEDPASTTFTFALADSRTATLSIPASIGERFFYTVEEG